MNNNTVISVNALGKKYHIGEKVRGYRTLGDSISKFFGRLSGKTEAKNNGGSKRDFWALDNISFEVKQGDVVGIIGHNGAGKSTLLKILSRITEPTKGYADVRGRIGSLLEVGTGFHPELTGRENIYLSGTILGMKKSDIDLRFDEIVAFAGVETFIDTPIKHYSSGMNLRLGFAVAAHLEPEILLVDEVLAVGDMKFQKKCLNKMEDVATEGRTVLFVSHNMGSVKELCRTGIVLKNGKVDYQGDIVQSIMHYSQNVLNVETEEKSTVGNNGWTRIIVNEGCENGGVLNTELFTVTADLALSSYINHVTIHCFLDDSEGNQVVHNRQEFTEFETGRHRIKAQVPPLYLKPGVYTLYLKLIGETKSGARVRYFSERVITDISDNTDLFSGKVKATILPPVEWSVSLDV